MHLFLYNVINADIINSIKTANIINIDNNITIRIRISLNIVWNYFIAFINNYSSVAS